jgi:hypothetical protein
MYVHVYIIEMIEKIVISCALCNRQRVAREETLVYICARAPSGFILILAAFLQIYLLFMAVFGSNLNVFGNIRPFILTTPKMAPESAKSSRPVRIANCSGALSMNTIHVYTCIMISFHY